METPLQSPLSFFHVGRNSADCTVNLINNGVNVLEGMVSVHFTGTGAASFYTFQVSVSVSFWFVQFIPKQLSPWVVSTNSMKCMQET